MARPGANKISDESGIALLVAVVLLLLISMIGVAALQHSQDEATSSGRARKRTANFHAADAGVRAAFDQLNDRYLQPNNTDCIGMSLMDDQGFYTWIETRNPPEPGELTYSSCNLQDASPARKCGTSLQNITGGYESGQPWCRLLRANVSATDQAGGRVRLQAQFSVLE